MFKGVLLLLIAEIFFALSTVFTKLIINESDISSIEITFFRFFLGLIIFSIIGYIKKISIIPQKITLVVWRAVLNTAAVIVFFYSLTFTSITNANMLNMTYPVFIFLISPMFIKEKSPRILYLFLGISLIGIYFIINPNFQYVNKGDVIALISGIIAAFAIVTLRMAREYDNTFLILFYLMLIGSILNFIMMIPVFKWFDYHIGIYILCSSIAGLLGQFLITWGYKFISAGPGALISSSKMIFAIFFGVFIFSEQITWRIAVGGILIFISLIGVALNQYKNYK